MHTKKPYKFALDINTKKNVSKNISKNRDLMYYFSNFVSLIKILIIQL